MMTESAPPQQASEPLRLPERAGPYGAFLAAAAASAGASSLSPPSPGSPDAGAGLNDSEAGRSLSSCPPGSIGGFASLADHGSHGAYISLPLLPDLSAAPGAPVGPFELAQPATPASAFTGARAASPSGFFASRHSPSPLDVSPRLSLWGSGPVSAGGPALSLGSPRPFSPLLAPHPLSPLLAPRPVSPRSHPSDRASRQETLPELSPRGTATSGSSTAAGSPPAVEIVTGSLGTFALHPPTGAYDDGSLEARSAFAARFGHGPGSLACSLSPTAAATATASPGGAPSPLGSPPRRAAASRLTSEPPAPLDPAAACREAGGTDGDFAAYGAANPEHDRDDHASACYAAGASRGYVEDGAHARPVFGDDAAEGSRRVVVLGLAWTTDEEALQRHFSQLGEVEECQIVRERGTGRSRGFGFVTYRDPAAARRAVEERHSLDGRRAEARLALPEGKVPPSRASRVFVARVPASVTGAEFRAHFERFGTVADAYMPKDPRRGVHRGIGFVTFATPEAAELAVASRHVLGGSEVAIDRATPKERTGPGGSAPAANGSRRGPPASDGSFRGGASLPDGSFRGGASFPDGSFHGGAPSDPLRASLAAALGGTGGGELPSLLASALASEGSRRSDAGTRRGSLGGLGPLGALGGSSYDGLSPVDASSLRRGFASLDASLRDGSAYSARGLADEPTFSLHGPADGGAPLASNLHLTSNLADLAALAELSQRSAPGASVWDDREPGWPVDKAPLPTHSSHERQQRAMLEAGLAASFHGLALAGSLRSGSAPALYADGSAYLGGALEAPLASSLATPNASQHGSGGTTHGPASVDALAQYLQLVSVLAAQPRGHPQGQARRSAQQGSRSPPGAEGLRPPTPSTGSAPPSRPATPGDARAQRPDLSQLDVAWHGASAASRALGRKAARAASGSPGGDGDGAPARHLGRAPGFAGRGSTSLAELAASGQQQAFAERAPRRVRTLSYPPYAGAGGEGERAAAAAPPLAAATRGDPSGAPLTAAPRAPPLAPLAPLALAAAAPRAAGPRAAGTGPRIFVGKLPKEATEADLRSHFSRYGYVLDVYLPRDKADRRSHRGFGFVTFETEAGVLRVLAAGSHSIRGAHIAIDAAVPRKEPDAPPARARQAARPDFAETPAAA